MKFYALFFLFLVGCSTSTTTTSPGHLTEAQREIISKNNFNDELQLVPRGIDFGNAPEVVAFGSCADQNKPQPIWSTIEKNNPDLFIFLGDNIYSYKSDSIPVSEQYKKLGRIPEFRSIREKVPFMAIWDDHDYGKNDGGADFEGKEAYKNDFLKFWPYVKDSLGLNQGGLYHSKLIGGVRKKDPTLQVIVLDTRYFRSPLLENPDKSDSTKKYIPNTDSKATILGETQWEWLEEQLTRPAQVRLIVSSIQFVAEGHGFEKWANFPKEKERLINLLKKTNAQNVFFLSGDRHLGTIAKQDIKGFGTLWDITASSMNKPSNLNETDPSYSGAPIKSENFGVASIDWKRKKIKFELKNLNNEVLNQTEVKLK